MAGCAGQPAEAPDAPSSEPMEYQIPQLEADPAAYGSKLTAYDMAAFDVLLGGAAGNNTEAQDALRLCPGIITTLRYGGNGNGSLGKCVRLLFPSRVGPVFAEL